MATVLASARGVPGLELELRTDTQFATAYLGGQPFAHVQRRRVIGEAHRPVWTVYLHGSSEVWTTADHAFSVESRIRGEARIALKLRAGVAVSQPAFVAADEAWSEALCEAFGCRPGSREYSRARYNAKPSDYPATPAGRAAEAAFRQRERCRLAWEHDTQAALERARLERASSALERGGNCRTGA